MKYLLINLKPYKPYWKITQKVCGLKNSHLKSTLFQNLPHGGEWISNGAAHYSVVTGSRSCWYTPTSSDLLWSVLVMVQYSKLPRTGKPGNSWFWHITSLPNTGGGGEGGALIWKGGMCMSGSQDLLFMPLLPFFRSPVAAWFSSLDPHFEQNYQILTPTREICQKFE